ncbi:MAG: cation:dicarboxylase symporter family transporter, partial [Lentisphaeria bacterium]|nr:cation:dicarboxylase symporter family transporter [Lentisphaeria bacterium]
YPLFVLVICRENPYRVLAAVREPVLTAFLTRSSAAALPVSLRVADEELHIRNELSGFALPLGATINMDGVCIHLPVFAILAANIFGIPLGMGQIFVLILSVVFASIGTGGIPGGSIFLLFMVLENMGLEAGRIATIVALAIGINPLLDMFETACNVAGDNIGNYVIARRNGMIG